MLGSGRGSGSAQPPGEKARRAPLDRLVGSCPSCKIGLQAFEVPAHPAFLEVCPRCFGMWFDRGELRLLRDEAVTVWLRKVLDTVRRNAGAV